MVTVSGSVQPLKLNTILLMLRARPHTVGCSSRVSTVLKDTSCCVVILYKTMSEDEQMSDCCLYIIV
jgi:hypothetical protein